MACSAKLALFVPVLMLKRIFSFLKNGLLPTNSPPSSVSILVMGLVIDENIFWKAFLTVGAVLSLKASTYM